MKRWSDQSIILIWINNALFPLIFIVFFFFLNIGLAERKRIEREKMSKAIVLDILTRWRQFLKKNCKCYIAMLGNGVEIGITSDISAFKPFGHWVDNSMWIFVPKFNSKIVYSTPRCVCVCGGDLGCNIKQKNFS